MPWPSEVSYQPPRTVLAYKVLWRPTGSRGPLLKMQEWIDQRYDAHPVCACGTCTKFSITVFRLPEIRRGGMVRRNSLLEPIMMDPVDRQRD